MGKLKEQVDILLDREIDRKQFLQYSAAIFLAAFGITGLIQAILNSDAQLPGAPKKNEPSGYSSSRYGR